MACQIGLGGSGIGVDLPLNGLSLPLGALESRAATKDHHARYAARVALLPMGELILSQTACEPL